MTSKQNLRSASRAIRTEAMRRSIGSRCKSNLSFQLLYSESFPWSSTIQNLCHAPFGSMWLLGLLSAHNNPSFRYCPRELLSLVDTEVSSRSRMPLNLLGVGAIELPLGDVDKTEFRGTFEFVVGDNVLIDE